MHKITNLRGEALFDIPTTRRVERHAKLGLAPHTLMKRAGLAVARLAMALTPHARCIWIACGPGDNGGDGFETAMQLHQWGQSSGLRVVVTWTEAHGETRANIQAGSADAQAARNAAIAAGVQIASEPPASFDLSIDALLGLGACYDANRPGSALMSQWLEVMHSARAPCLAIDLPTWLNADTGVQRGQNTSKIIAEEAVNARTTARFTLSLLTLKPGLFTADGRDLAGEVWFDDLGVLPCDELPSAWLLGQDRVSPARAGARHASHKGSFGDVAVVGGESSSTGHMAGAAILAARAALHAGAGRVWVSLLAAQTGEKMSAANGMGQCQTLTVDVVQPELMFRSLDALALNQHVVVAGCGGGHAIGLVLPQLLTHARRLVLDADALNAIADSTRLQAALIQRSNAASMANAVSACHTVLTPHPLEAARLLGTTVQAVQANRLGCAQALAARFQAVVVLKGSGTVITGPSEKPCINFTGNALLATAGTGDVLAGMVGAYLANGLPPMLAACSAVFAHGQLADCWAARTRAPLTASMLATQQQPR